MYTYCVVVLVIFKDGHLEMVSQLAVLNARTLYLKDYHHAIVLN